MYDLHTYVLLMIGVTTVTGGLVTFYAVRAAQRTGQESLWFLAVGIACIAVGAIITGGGYCVLDLESGPWIGIVSTLSAAGFTVMGYSLFVDGSVPGA